MANYRTGRSPDRMMMIGVLAGLLLGLAVVFPLLTALQNTTVHLLSRRKAMRAVRVSTPECRPSQAELDAWMQRTAAASATRVAIATMVVDCSVCPRMAAAEPVPSLPARPLPAVSQPDTVPLSMSKLLMNYEYPSSMLQYPVTTLTAYFPSDNAKHSPADYRAWISNLLSFNTQPMVVATSKAAFPFLAGIRHRKCLAEAQVPEPKWDASRANKYVGQLPNSCFPTYWILDYQDPLDVPINVPLRDQYLKLLSKDPDRATVKNSPFIYAVWAAKSWFLNYTAELNPFSSNYFNYIDASYCREDACRYSELVDYNRVIDMFESFDDEHTTHVDQPAYKGTPQLHPRRPLEADLMEAKCRRVANSDEPDVSAETRDDSAFYPRSEWPTSGAEVRCTFPRVNHPHPAKKGVASRRHKLMFEQIGDVAAKLRTEFRCPRPIRALLDPQSSDPPRTAGSYMSGRFILGSGPAVRWYAALYNSTLHQYSRNRWYYGTDRLVQNFLVSLYPNSFLMLDAHTGGCQTPAQFFPQYFQSPLNRQCSADQYLASKVHPMSDNCEVQEPNEDMRPRGPRPPPAQ